MVTGIIYSEDYLNHVTGSHVESPQRLIATIKLLKERGIWENNPKYQIITPRKATLDQIRTVHSDHMIQRARDVAMEAKSGGNLEYLDGDTVMCGDSYEIALLAAGGVLEGVDQILKGKIQNAFALVRPPGHHSNRDYSRGFCVFNNAAIALRYLITEKNIQKAVIVDWDCHHGNGTQDIFYEGIPGTDKGDFMYISSHQDGRTLYPGSGFINEIGKGRAKGRILNMPLAPRSTDEVMRELYDEIVMPVLEEFKPEFIIVSAGFDAHFTDPITNLGWSVQWYGEMLQKLKVVADKIAQGRILVTLEGGYELKAISSSIVNCLQALGGDPCTEKNDNAPKTDPDILGYTRENVIKAIKDRFSEFWKFQK
ncbi:MAG: histone deacetylase superfamily protein [Promethearchaeota archaeon CR_4]|nr:MAG: histone deacetylase superfamily protein [Candidatus Lokiarchaeota archaeon CR_4]